jgi:hypothetical protein
VIKADADDSYDFSQLTPFLATLREGYDIVQGCRLRWVAGKVSGGAMPPSQRWIGNPFFPI